MIIVLVFYFISYFPSLFPAMGQHDTISFQFSVQFSVLGFSGFSLQRSVFSFHFSLQLSVFSFQFSVLEGGSPAQQSSVASGGYGHDQLSQPLPSRSLMGGRASTTRQEACIRQALEFKFKDYLALVLLVADYSDYRGAPIVSRLRRLRPIPV